MALLKYIGYLSMKLFNKPLVLAFCFSTVLVLLFPFIVHAATVPTVDLGTAENFAVLAGTEITNVPTSVITGDVGLSPAAGGNYAGLTDAEVTGTIYAVDGAGPAGSVNNPALLTTAKNDLTTAYLDAAGRTPNQTFTGTDNQLGGQTLAPGVYAFPHADTANLTAASPLILDAQGDPNAVFIFQASSDLITASGSTVSLINGAQACNVFWQVTSSATLGTGSTFVGTIMALTSITVASDVDVEGRLLARNGAVTLIADTITSAICTITDTELPDTNGLTVANKTIPWNTLIVILATISTGAFLLSISKKKTIA